MVGSSISAMGTIILDFLLNMKIESGEPFAKRTAGLIEVLKAIENSSEFILNMFP